MAALDPNITPERVLAFVRVEKAQLDKEVDVKVDEKTDEENVAYYAGQLDMLEKIEAFLTV